MYDVTKIISMIKGKRGEHRLLRLAENLCMNLILSLRDFFLVKKELKVPCNFRILFCFFQNFENIFLYILKGPQKVSYMHLQ